jgi:hypothetical protein
MMVAVGWLSLLSFTAHAGAGPGKGEKPVLVLAADALAKRQLAKASAVAAQMARTVPSGEPQARSLLRLVDALYQDLQFDGAGVALQLAAHCEPISITDQAQLGLRRGLLQMESIDEAGARRAFQEALSLERTARLPAFAPPKTAELLEEIRSALLPPPPPALAAVPKPPPAPEPEPAPSLRSWAWAPAAGGAAMGVAGGALYLLAKGNYDRLARHDPALATMEQVLATAQAGQVQQACAVVLFGAGGAALATAAVFAFRGEPGSFQASVQVGPAPGVVVMGVFP